MRYIVLFLIVVLVPLPAFSQLDKYLQKDPLPTIMNQWGVAFSVLEGGTGIGGFIEMPLKGLLAVPWGEFIHIGATADFFFIRDSREFQYSDGYNVYVFNRQNNVYMGDFLLTLRKRLFADQLHDSFQPFIMVSAGGIYGINFPEDKTRPREQAFALTAAGAVGVNAVVDKVYLFGVRLQYRYINFGRRVGETKDHSTLDLRLELGRRF
ncbi:MAG TPA: hypothetical protein EYP36_12225 [Calditrichaeota bacterium]|nr:hypothetical protein [Calditrichota bacterium]